MCGGAIISDYDPISERRRRKISTHDLWAELDPISELWSFNSSSAINGLKQSSPSTLPDATNRLNQGNISFVFLKLLFKSFSFLICIRIVYF